MLLVNLQILNVAKGLTERPFASGTVDDDISVLVALGDIEARVTDGEGLHINKGLHVTRITVQKDKYSVGHWLVPYLLYTLLYNIFSVKSSGDQKDFTGRSQPVACGPSLLVGGSTCRTA